MFRTTWLVAIEVPMALPNVSQEIAQVIGFSKLRFAIEMQFATSGCVNRQGLLSKFQ
jgi:hypothetical protein